MAAALPTEVGGTGLFTSDIEAQLLDGRLDLAVHSLKDLPTGLPDGLVIGAVSPRADLRDALVSRDSLCVADLPPGARIGTGSLRRQAQLRLLRDDVDPVPIRGNVETRIRKIEAEGLDGVILAAAGLERLGLLDGVAEFLCPEQMLPAPGQGAIGIEVRADDQRTREAVSVLDHPETGAVVTSERAVLAGLGGGCRLPVGAWGRMQSSELLVDALAALPDGSKVVRGRRSGPPESAESVGAQLAQDLAARGATEILAGLGG